jgi:peptidoglycan/xylan/chitin deacetylase (PgdA/CDA1 family)
MHVSGKKPITEPAFLISFDDGYRDLLITKEYFKMNNIKPVIFLLADGEHANRAELDTKRPFLTKENIFELKNAGWNIGSHTLTHPDMLALKGTEIDKEVLASRTALEQQIGLPVPYFAYPKGEYSPEVLGAIRKAGYTLAFSMNEGLVAKGSNPLTVPRIGVDRTHTFGEFKALFSPAVMGFKSMVKKFI